MNDDSFDADWTAQEIALLGSAELDVAPEGSTERTLAALGLGATVAASGAALTAGASGAPVTVGKGVAAWLKWVGVLAVGAGAMGAGVLALKSKPPGPVVAPAPRSAAAAAPSPSIAPAPAVEPVPPTVVTSLPDPEPPRAAVAPSARSAPKVKPVPIADEIRAIDEARKVLRAGDPAAALRILTSYDQLVAGRGSMQAEATIVRIEALERSGNHAAALTLGKRFLESHPHSPYQSYLERLLKLP